MALTKDQILKAKDVKFVDVDVPEWGGVVFIKTLTGTERDAFEESIIRDGKANLTNIRAKLCVRTIVNEKGERLFADNDIAVLGAKSAKALDRIFAAAQKLNGITAEDIEELEKNSEAGQSEDSTSD